MRKMVSLKAFERIAKLMGARERFIDSIEYLKKMRIFEDHSNLTSEEIFEKVMEGSIMLGNVEKEGRKWAKESDFGIDISVASTSYRGKH